MTWFNINAEYPTQPEAELADRMTELLTRYHVSVSRTPTGMLGIRISLQAESVRHAVDVALVLLADALARAGLPGLEATAVEAMTEEEFDRREQQPPVPELVSAQEAADILDVSRQRILQTVERLGGIKVGSTWVFPRNRVEAAR